MVKKISYSIRFPLGFSNNYDPEYLFIKKIYQDIKRFTCMNEERDCKNCIKKEKCIYHLLSGNNFDYYPSILIRRNIVNKTTYFPNEAIIIEIYLIGIACMYQDFILEFFRTADYINEIFFQKIIKENITLDSNNTYDGKLVYDTIISKDFDVIDCINYYNEFYKASFDIPVINDINILRKCSDTKKYIINNKSFRYDGCIYSCNVKNYPEVLTSTGVGKYAIIGGGRSHASSN